MRPIDDVVVLSCLFIRSVSSFSVSRGSGGARRVATSAAEKAIQAHEAALSRQGASVPASASREAHNSRQANVFSGETVAYFASAEATPPDVAVKLDRIAAAVPGDRVLDVGTGTGCLARRYAATSVVGVDLSSEMIAAAEAPNATFWCGDVVDYEDAWVESGEPPFDAAVFNACFGNVFDQKDALRAAAAVVRPGGQVVVSHPLGAAFVDDLRRLDPTVVRHSLPTSLADLDRIAPAFLEPADLVDEPDFYLARWSRRAFAPLEPRLFLRGPVARGYGRGSKKLGFPTANLPEDMFGAAVADLPTGVYCGWATVADGASYPAVANVGFSPTFQGAENPVKIVEAHICDYDGDDFYDQPLAILLAAFLRPERKFPTFDRLLAQITHDVQTATRLLHDDPILVRPFSIYLSCGSSLLPRRNCDITPPSNNYKTPPRPRLPGSHQRICNCVFNNYYGRRRRRPPRGGGLLGSSLDPGADAARQARDSEDDSPQAHDENQGRNDGQVGGEQAAQRRFPRRRRLRVHVRAWLGLQARDHRVPSSPRRLPASRGCRRVPVVRAAHRRPATQRLLYRVDGNQSNDRRRRTHAASRPRRRPHLPATRP